MGAVSDCAQVVITEVRRQLREKPGILNHTEKPNYSRMVSLITASSIHAMIGPGSIALLIPICVGIWFKSSFLGGLLVSNTACGFMLSTMMATSGGAWDNAKKYVESGKHGGKHSEAHKATVVGKLTIFTSIYVLFKSLTVMRHSKKVILSEIPSKIHQDRAYQSSLRFPISQVSYWPPFSRSRLVFGGQLLSSSLVHLPLSSL